MKIGIIGAMDEEILELRNNLVNGKELKIAGNIFFEGKLFGNECILVKSGVGKVYAAMTVQILISHFNVERIIFTGLAGSINRNIKIGDIVICEKCVQYDMDASELGFKVGQIPYTQLRFFEADKKMQDIALKTKIPETKIVKGVILTGDAFLNHEAQKRYKSVFLELKGDCLEMEGAAVAQVCVLNKVPFCIIRIISDNADEHALQDFEKFKTLVSHKSVKIIESIIESIGGNKI
jgi:adenosylhomocysteine nucleosidase